MAELFTITSDTAKGASSVEVKVEFQSSSIPSKSPSYRVPLLLLRSEAYYWSYEWQHDETEALKELQRGEGKIFYDPQEAVRWLNSPEDE